MKKAVVLYASKYGATRRYAQWIAQELCCNCLEQSGRWAEQLAAYDVIIYGGGLYGGTVNGLKKLVQASAAMREKQYVLFTCGLANPSDMNNANHIRERLSKALPPELRQAMRVFHLRGAIDFEKLHFADKMMMSMMRMALRKKGADMSDEDRSMLAAFEVPVDFTDKTALAPLTEYVRGL